VLTALATQGFWKTEIPQGRDGGIRQAFYDEDCVACCDGDRGSSLVSGLHVIVSGQRCMHYLIIPVLYVTITQRIFSNTISWPMMPGVR